MTAPHSSLAAALAGSYTIDSGLGADGKPQTSSIPTASRWSVEAMVRPHHISSDVAELQLRRYRAMTADEKLARADALWDLAWELTQAGVRMRHPDFDDATAAGAARAIVRRATE